MPTSNYSLCEPFYAELPPPPVHTGRNQQAHMEHKDANHTLNPLKEHTRRTTERLQEPSNHQAQSWKRELQSSWRANLQFLVSV